MRFLHETSVNVLPVDIHRPRIRIPPGDGVRFRRFLILVSNAFRSCNSPLFVKGFGGERRLLLAGVEDV